MGREGMADRYNKPDLPALHEELRLPQPKTFGGGGRESKMGKDYNQGRKIEPRDSQ